MMSVNPAPSEKEETIPNETDPQVGDVLADGMDNCDDNLDSGVFQIDSNFTESEDENVAQLLSSCTDRIVGSLDSISNSSVDHGDIIFHDSSEIEPYITDAVDIYVNNQTSAIEEVSPNLICQENVSCSQIFNSAVCASETGDTLNTSITKASDSQQTVSVCEATDDRYSSVTGNDETDSALNMSGVEKIPADIPNGISETTVTRDVKSSSTNKNVTYNEKKLRKIELALKKGNTDFLRSAAISKGGLLNDDIRKKVWPKLVGVDVVETSPRPCQKQIEAHPYYNQVVLDVNRSLKRFPPSIKEAQRLTMLDQLVFLIMRVLCCHPEMHYYQGYHDICVTFLLVLGDETAYHVIEKLSRTHLNVFMEKNMEPTIHLLEYMYVLIGKKNPPLNAFLAKSVVGVGYCLSWLITWFGHVLNDYDSVVRLFDFFIVSHPWMPMYLTTAVVLHREKEVLKQECDMAAVHCLLSNIPDDLPFEELLRKSISLHDSFDPKLLAVERPYVKKNKLVKHKKGWRLFQSVTKTIKSAVPASPIALPMFLVTAAVVVSAVIYQAYKY